MVFRMNAKAPQEIVRPSLRDRKPWAATLTVVVAVAGMIGYLSLTAPNAAIGLGLGLLVAVLVARDGRRQSDQGRSLVEPCAPAALVSHPDLLAAHHSLAHSLGELAGQSDEILREATILKLTAIQDEVRTLAAGKVVFADTEAWRTVYERILRTPGLDRYFSVAWLRNEDYWRDAPGRRGMRLNYDLVQLGVRIERTFILNDFFWPPAAVLPAKVICRWIEDQHKRGIVVRLVRESQIEDEPGLLSDFGIYGDRAAGQLGLDDQCRTIQFTFDFNPHAVQRFEEQWRRLLLFSVSFRDLLDRKAGDA